MLPDYHFHSSFSGDSETPIRSQIEQAIALSMNSLCVTDHHDYDVDSDIDFTLNLDQYFQTMTELREEFKDQIDLRIGIELGLQPHLEEYYKSLLTRYDFDYVIGSTHFVNRKDVSYPEFFEGRLEEEAYLQYFKATLDNVKLANAYDTAGHMDYIVRYGPNKNKYYNYKAYQDLFDEILRTIIGMGKGIELNTAGYRKGISQPNPSADILKRYRQLGGEIITVGSDAHISNDLGADFETALKLLKHCGFTHYTEFKKRKPEFKPL